VQALPVVDRRWASVQDAIAAMVELREQVASLFGCSMDVGW
jgi:hypothetical protein